MFGFSKLVTWLAQMIHDASRSHFKNTNLLFLSEICLSGDFSNEGKQISKF